MQPVLIAHHILGAQHVVGDSLVAGQQRQQRRAIRLQQTVSFFINEQIAQAIQYRGRLFICHRDGNQQRDRLLIGGKCTGGTADRNRAAQVAFRAVVQPDALPKVQRLIIDGAADEGGVNGASLFQTCGVQRL